MPLKQHPNEAGFTMIMTVIGLSVIASMVLVAVTAVSGDIHTSRYDLDQKRAFEAAKAGIDDYAYHLFAQNSYWTSCDNVPSPSAVNQVGSTAKRRPVPGTTGATYAIEMLPSTTQATYSQCNTSNPTLSMLESSGTLKGTFRIRSTGFAGDTDASIVATFKPASFLDYVYFTQRETSDPVTYGTEALINAAYIQCGKTIEEDRYEEEILEDKGYCDVISFVSGDSINGPMHTNDAFVICGSPTLGRTDTDPVEVSAPPIGWYSTVSVPHSGSSCSGSNKNFKGTFTANSAVLTPPPTNTELKNLADASFRYKGQYRLCLNGASMTVMTLTAAGTCASPTSVVYSGSIPANGIVYFESGVCSSAYTPFNVSYAITEPPSECGNVYVEGNYTGQLTIAAQNDIVVTNNICLESCETKLPFSGTGVLGLVANNFVRIYHPHTEVWSSSKNKYVCSANATGTLQDVRIDGAILAIDHSFIVDDYNCGAKLGTLTVNGAIAQKYRGAVGTTGSSGSGYLKSYNYDDRLRYTSPPSFIEPEKTAWVIGRETLD